MAKKLTHIQKLALQELSKRSERTISNINVFETALPQQIEFCKDPAKLKAILATRRAAKSYTAGLYLYDEAIKNPGVSLIYIALTRSSAKKIMVKDVLKLINEKHKIGAIYNMSDLTFTLPNGSTIYLVGMDSSAKEMEKALGQKFRLAIIDEAASFTQDLRDIVYKTLEPAMTDLNGTICLIGTPGNNVSSLFFKITTGLEQGWSVYKWKASDNPYVAENIKKTIAKKIKDNPLFIETSEYKQMYLGEWVIDSDKLVYKFNEDRNVIDALPKIPKGSTWNYALGVDLGYVDDSAFVVVAFNEYDPNLYVCEVYSKPGMDLTDVVNKVKELETKYDFYKYIVDGSDKQSVEQMRNRNGIPFEAAEKIGKANFIEIINADLTMGIIKLVKGATEKLSDEWKILTWVEKSAKKVENPANPNHLSDAFLYIWRYCHNYASTKYIEPKKFTPEEQMNDWLEREQESIAEELMIQNSKEWWEE